MLSRFVRVPLAVGLLAAAALVASPAAAHYPDQHDSQYIDPKGAIAPGAGGEALTSFECQNGTAGPYPCKNVDLASFVPLPGLGVGTGNDIWGWTDPQTGREYALMGTATTTGFVDVTDPENPQLVGQLPTSGVPDFVLWRDIKVDGHYAFIVSEVTGHGMQVFDLHKLRDAGPTPTVFQADTVYHGEDADGNVLSNSHNIMVNEETDTAYLVGTNTCTNGEEAGGLHMVDISDPLNPTFAGCAVVRDADGDDDTESNNYVHDVECVIYRGPDADYQGREICFGSNENAVVIYDVTDRSNPVVVSQTSYPSAAYTHQGSLTEDQKHFLFGDELDELDGTVQRTTTYVMRAQNLDHPDQPKLHTHDTTAIDHNMYVQGNRVFQSNYSAGLRILEFDKRSLRAGQLNEVGYFDVFPAADPTEFVGTWSNYRFDSGTVVVSSIENQVSGLFVLRPQLPDGPGGGKPDKPAKGSAARS